MIRGDFQEGPPPALVLSGEGRGPDAVSLEGRRARVTGTVSGDGATGWTATLPLTAARWGGPPRALPSGDYRLTLTGDGGGAAPASVPVTDLGILRAGLEGARVHIGPPVDPAEAAEAERAYAGGREPLTDAVFFESFYGRNASCNPLALDREIARVAPGVTRYWSVVDLSVVVPEGAVPVVEGSPQWWHARAVSRLLIVNDWLRRSFVRRPGQHVLQTWHGTPLKRLALHRPGFDPRRAAAVIKERSRWDVLLAQNPYSVRTLARAYAFGRKPVWVEGYPRNDVLVSGDEAAVRAARAALGVGPDERVLLYAPTWRDDREEIVDFLDPERLAADTGAVVLVRGHSRTLQPGRDAAGERVVDVTTFPDLTQLLLAADALITDYSSVMFDFSATGKPMFFFVPDLDHYRGRLRGFYFDLAERAPGPVVATQQDLTEALLAAADDRFAEAYEAWRARFNARDDGRASERVVARLFDQGFLVAD